MNDPVGMKLENPCQVNQVVLAEGSHLLQTFSKRVHSYLLFQKHWVFSLQVPPLPLLVFDLWKEKESTLKN